MMNAWLFICCMCLPAFAQLKLYCPQGKTDMRNDNGGPGKIDWNGNGFTVTGSARVSSKMSWDITGGYIEFSLDTTNSKHCINTNVYVVAPNGNTLSSKPKRSSKLR